MYSILYVVIALVVLVILLRILGLYERDAWRSDQSGEKDRLRGGRGGLSSMGARTEDETPPQPAAAPAGVGATQETKKRRASTSCGRPPLHSAGCRTRIRT